jgi:hypothetical protein
MDATPFKKWLREPLVHFLLLGALLFLFSAWKGGPSARASRIVVTRARIEELRAGFLGTWQRPPTEAELAGLIEEDIRDEVSVREAVAGGLDLNDPIIRRRLRRKLELSNEEAVEAASPTDEDLRVFLKAHPESLGLPGIGADGRPRELAEVRETVEREWRAAQRKERDDALFRKLLARYQVVVEAPAESKPDSVGRKAT